MIKKFTSITHFFYFPKTNQMAMFNIRKYISGSWIMSGNTILKDGRSINENYGTDLDKLEEQDRVGVVRTSNGDLVFYVNGVI